MCYHLQRSLRLFTLLPHLLNTSECEVTALPLFIGSQHSSSDSPHLFNSEDFLCLAIWSSHISVSFCVRQIDNKICMLLVKFGGCYKFLHKYLSYIELALTYTLSSILNSRMSVCNRTWNGQLMCCGQKVKSHSHRLNLLWTVQQTDFQNNKASELHNLQQTSVVKQRRSCALRAFPPVFPRMHLWSNASRRESSVSGLGISGSGSSHKPPPGRHRAQRLRQIIPRREREGGDGDVLREILLPSEEPFR